MSKLLFTIFIFIFVKSFEDYLLVPVFNSLGILIAGLLSVWFINARFNIKFQRPKIAELIYYLKQSSPFFFSRASVSMYTNTNTFVIGIFLGNTAAGYFSAAEKLFNALNALYTPLNNVLYPYMSKYKNMNLYTKFFIFTFFFNLIVCLAVYLLSEWVIITIYGESYFPAISLLKIFSVLGILIVPSTLLGYPLLGALGYSNYANNSVIIASIIHVLLLIAIIPIISIYFVGVLLIVTQIIVLFIRLLGVYKNILKKEKHK